MDLRTQAAKGWLDRRYSKTVDGQYFAHAPVYGFGSSYSEPNQVLRLARAFSLLRILNTLPFHNFLDVGGGEGYTTALVRDLFGVPAYCSDISVEAGLQARHLFGIQSVANEAARLPFKDNSFDLVLCSEVIEHLATPVYAISELARVASKYLVITTAEFCPLGEIERALRVAQLEIDYPHAERNWFTRSDFLTLLGDEITLSSQMRNFGGYGTQFFGQKDLTHRQVEIALELLTASTSVDPNHDGVIVVCRRHKAEAVNDRNVGKLGGDSKAVINKLLSPSSSSTNNLGSTIDVDLVPSLICLACGGSLASGGNQLVCGNCGQRYKVRDGVPTMFLESENPARENAGDAETLLSQADQRRAERIRALTAKLHGARSQKVNRYKKFLAQQFLKILWMFFRPGPVKGKILRIVRRFRKDTPAELAWLEQQLTER